MFGTVDAQGLKALQKRKDVAKVRTPPVFSLIRPKHGVLAKLQAVQISWGIERLNVEPLWSAGLTGKGVVVGHLDTGVDAKHPALKGAVKHYARFDDNGDLVPNAKARDSDKHGTHTAGTIAARTVKGKRFGVAPGAMLASAEVIEGGDAVARVLGGMDWVIGKQARILSMSLGFRGYTEDFLELVKRLRSRGVLPVFAVGNEGPNTSRSPGNYAEALSVGAFDSSDAVADFSSSQTFVRKVDPIVPDLVGPGVQVFSCIPGNKYALFDGSSMATPHIAGLAALLLEAVPTATVDQLEAAIFASCSRPSKMNAARANRGVPDAEKALNGLRSAVAKAAKKLKAAA
jgi:subtilisin family serine protease